MNTNTKLNEINNLINNSNKSYFDRYKEDVLADMKSQREKLLKGTQEVEEVEDDLDIELEYTYSSYINEANITRHELEFDGRGQFQIGNNLPSAE